MEKEAYIKAMEKLVRFPFANRIKGCKNRGEETIYSSSQNTTYNTKNWPENDG